MPKLDLSTLSNQIKGVYEKTKRNVDSVKLGNEKTHIPYYVPAPKAIQKLIGLPGYPFKRITQIAGKTNSGKTSLAMLAMVEAQKDDCYVIMIDSEKKFSMSRFEKMKGDPEKLLVFPATTIEDAFFGIDTALNTILAQDPEGKVFIVFDSIGGMPSKAEAEADADKTIQLATAAKVVKKELRCFVQRLDEYNIGLLLINQMYANIGSVGYTNSGGSGVDYHSAIVLQMKRVADLKRVSKGEQYLYGIEAEVTSRKNHLLEGEQTLYKNRIFVTAYEVNDEKPNSRKKRDDVEEEIISEPVVDDEN